MTKEKRFSPFLIGFLFSGLAWLIFWYWQKSTSAEDGVLDMLDRLKVAEAKMQAAQAKLAAFTKQQAAAQTAVSIPPIAAQTPDDLQQIKGVGPVFTDKLQAAGLTTFAAVAGQTADFLSDLLEIGPNRAANIRAEAQKLVGA